MVQIMEKNYEIANYFGGVGVPHKGVRVTWSWIVMKIVIVKTAWKGIKMFQKLIKIPQNRQKPVKIGLKNVQKCFASSWNDVKIIQNVVKIVKTTFLSFFKLIFLQIRFFLHFNDVFSDFCKNLHTFCEI